VDDALMTLWAARPAVTPIPNLPSPGVPADLSWIETVPEAQLIELQARETERPEAREAFGIQARNLERLHEAGMPVAFGTDGGTPWAVHLELEDMVRAGLTPHEAIVAATSGSAAFLDLQEVGAIAAGKSADFVVLDRDPLQDITATRSISDVYLRGSMIDREAIRARLLGGGA